MAEPNHLQGSMYGRPSVAEENTSNNNIHNHHLDEEDDEVAGGEESIDNPQIRYEVAGAAAMNGVQEVGANSLYVSGEAGITDYAPLAVENGGSDQLTLSFQGEVYVFDAVSPEKVIWDNRLNF